MFHKIVLVSSDKIEFVASKEFISKSKIIEELIVLHEHFEMDKNTVVPVNVKYEVLLKIQKWLEHHKDSSSMEVDGDEGDDSDSETADQCKVSSWDAEFLKEDAQMLVAVMNAANFLNIEDLLTTCCKVIASLFHGKTASEIREILKITNDLSPEEVARIRKESAWLTQN